MTSHKHYVLMGVVAAVSTACLAQDVGRVIASQPVIQQVSVPRQVCSNQSVVVQQPNSGAGAALGAIAGGAMGNAVGKGAGNVAATMLGLVGGAVVGDRIEGSGGAQVQNVQNCVTQTTLENRTVGYNVTYEFAGRQYTVQMPQDPGPTVRLQVTPVGAQAAAPQTPPNLTYTQPAYTQPVYTQPVYQQAPVVVQPAVTYQPVYVQPYYAQPYYPPVGLNFEFGFGHWGGYRHWR